MKHHVVGSSNRFSSDRKKASISLHIEANGDSNLLNDYSFNDALAGLIPPLEVAP